MLWVALATAIMILSGELSRESDNSGLIALLLARLRGATTQHVTEGPRRARALCALGSFDRALDAYRRQREVFNACVRAADRNYAAKQADYAVCSARLETERAGLHESLVAARGEYEAALTPVEKNQISRDILALPEAKLLDPESSLPPKPLSRFRGLEGVATERHTTLPRNVVSVVYGPLGPTTFGQRYPSKIIDGGTSYAHQDQARASATGTPPELWNMRGGARVGMFDDFEVGALFMALELAPKFRFDPVLLTFTQQFRLGDFELALRASVQTPGGPGWALSPGVLFAWRGPRLAARAGVFVPMEVGTLRTPIPPWVGFNAPLRVIWNVVPSFFVSGDTGVAYDNFAVPGILTVPLGFGAGYTALVGSKLLELTTSFTWDHWLLPAREQGPPLVQLDAFRVAFGASLYFQAL